MNSNVSPEELRKILAQTADHAQPPPLQPTPKKVPPLVKTLLGAAAGLVVYLVIAANQNDGTGPVASKPEHLEPKDIVQTYMANAVRGDQIYKGRRLEVEVEVFQIVNEPWPGLITMQPNGGTIVGCLRIRQGQESALAALSRSDSIRLTGTVEGAMDGAVSLTDCIMSRLSPAAR